MRIITRFYTYTYNADCLSSYLYTNTLNRYLLLVRFSPNDAGIVKLGVDSSLISLPPGMTLQPATYRTVACANNHHLVTIYQIPTLRSLET
mgnify:CR=1 FL=1